MHPPSVTSGSVHPEYWSLYSVGPDQQQPLGSGWNHTVFQQAPQQQQQQNHVQQIQEPNQGIYSQNPPSWHQSPSLQHHAVSQQHSISPGPQGYNIPPQYQMQPYRQEHVAYEPRSLTPSNPPAYESPYSFEPSFFQPHQVQLPETYSQPTSQSVQRQNTQPANVPSNSFRQPITQYQMHADFPENIAVCQRIQEYSSRSSILMWTSILMLTSLLLLIMNRRLISLIKRALSTRSSSPRHSRHLIRLMPLLIKMSSSNSPPLTSSVLITPSKSPQSLSQYQSGMLMLGVRNYEFYHHQDFQQNVLNQTVQQHHEPTQQSQLDLSTQPTIPQLLQFRNITSQGDNQIPVIKQGKLRFCFHVSPLMLTRVDPGVVPPVKPAKAAAPKKKKSSPTKSSQTKVKKATSKASTKKQGSKSASSSSESDSYDDSDLDIEIPEEPSPIPATRPQDPVAAAEYDTLKAVWSPRNRRPAVDTIKTALVAFKDVVKSVRDAWKEQSQAMKVAENQSDNNKAAEIKKNVTLQRRLMEVVVNTALEKGHPIIVEKYVHADSFLKHLAERHCFHACRCLQQNESYYHVNLLARTLGLLLRKGIDKGCCLHTHGLPYASNEHGTIPKSYAGIKIPLRCRLETPVEKSRAIWSWSTLRCDNMKRPKDIRFCLQFILSISCHHSLHEETVTDRMSRLGEHPMAVAAMYSFLLDRHQASDYEGNLTVSLLKVRSSH